jgi:hypothetical protein
MSLIRRRDSFVPKVGTALAALGVLVVLFPLTLTSEVAGAATATSPDVSFHTAATLTGPVTVGHVVEPLSAHSPDLAANGYVEQEYFASGTAMAFKADSMPSDGKWTITPTTTASYKTRILVRRPSNPAHFNGTVIVEWMNVSAGESAPDWDFLNPMLMRDGYAYVGVSAQALAVDGGKALLGTPGSTSSNGGLVGDEPARYGTLHHPGDQYSLDMYAQIGQALSAPHDAALGGLKPKHILAVGESQSAFYLTTFADALQPRTNVYDGIFIHSRGGSGASIAGTSIASSSGPDNLRIRTDLKVPVFMSQTQTDLIQLGYAPAQQPNTDKIRTWEIAGTRSRRRLHRGRRGQHPRLHHAREQRPAAQRRPGGVHRVRQVGRQRNAAPEPASLHAVEHTAGRSGPRCTRQRDRGCQDTGGRRPGLHPEWRTGRRRQCNLWPVRVHRRLHAGAARQPLRHTEQLHRPVHEEPGQGDRRRVHPQRGQGPAAGPGGAGGVPRLVRLTRDFAMTVRSGATSR